MENVKNDIEKLHNKFKQPYATSESCRSAKLRDIPPITGAIMWARQIERQLDGLVKRVEDVLGQGWEEYVEGRKLNEEAQSFRRKLDARPVT